MSVGLLSKNTANLGIAVSGIMGPESDDTLKKVGSVWSCYKYKEHIKTLNFKVAGSRSENREETAKTVIINLYDFINEL